MIEKTRLEKEDFDNSVIYFGAVAWCQPCKFLHPLMEQMAVKYKDLSFVYVDADNAPDLLKEHQVFSVPTIKIFNGGEEKRSFVGIQSKNVFDQEFSEYSEVTE